MEMGMDRARVRGDRDPREVFRVETSFTISVPGAVARGRGVLLERPTGRVPAILTGVPGSSGVRGLGGGQGAGGHGTAGARNPAPLGAGAEGGDGESGSRGTVWHKSRGEGRSGTPRTPNWARGMGRVGKAWDGRALGLGQNGGPEPGRGPARGPWGRGRLGCQTGGAVPPAVRMLKYSVKPVCGDAVWGTSGW